MHVVMVVINHHRLKVDYSQFGNLLARPERLEKAVAHLHDVVGRPVDAGHLLNPIPLIIQ